MPVGDIYSIDIHSRYQNNDNIYCYVMRVDAISDAGALVTDLAAYGELVIEPALIVLHVSAVKFRCVDVHQIHPTNALPHITDLEDDSGVRSTTQLLPGQLSAVATIFGDTTDPTQRNRGRDYFYGQDSADLDVGGDKWDTGYLADLCTFYQVMNDGFIPLSGNEFQLGVFSRKQAKENIDPQFVSNGGAVPDPPTFGDPVFNQVELYRMRGLIRTQRRRQPEDFCEEYTDCDPLGS